VDVDELSPTNTRGDDECDEDGNPSAVFVPVENFDATKGYKEGNRRNYRNSNGPTDIGGARKRLATHYATQDNETKGNDDTEKARDYGTIVSTGID